MMTTAEQLIAQADTVWMEFGSEPFEVVIDLLRPAPFDPTGSVTVSWHALDNTAINGIMTMPKHQTVKLSR